MRDRESNIPDLAGPLNSQGDYGNGMGGFQLDRSLERKVKSRKDLSQPQGKAQTSPNKEITDATDRYFGSFSLESKRHVWDLLRKHPLFGDEPPIRKNRIRNNTTEVLPNDPLKIVTNGGYIVYNHPETNDPESQRS